MDIKLFTWISAAIAYCALWWKLTMLNLSTSDLAVMRAEIADVKAELRSEITSVKTELRTDIARLRTEFREEITRVRASIREIR